MAGRLYVGQSIGDVLKAENIEPDVEAEGIVWNHRRSGDDDWYFIAPAKEGGVLNSGVKFRATGTPEIWWPSTGRIEMAEEGNSLMWPCLAPDESCFVVFRRSQNIKREAQDRWAHPTKGIIPLDAPWRISFPDGFGMPTNMTVMALAPWKELGPTLEAKAFSGTATYETDFNVYSSSPVSIRTLCLGRVDSIAKVTLNGKTYPTIWAPPYIVDVTDAVKFGMNHLKIEVTDTWFNRMTYDSGVPEPKRRTWAFRRPRKTEPLRDSGLIGPVEIVSQK